MSPLADRLWHRRMTARSTDEPHRVSTPLELFFDLIFVVAVAQAATSWEHALGDDRFGAGLTAYAMAFFAIWWAWMNFSWFASAYDVDDGPYRLLTLVQAAGALVMAAGIARVPDDFTVVVVGYVIMRLAMVTQWLRAAAADRYRRTTALEYAVGITVVQGGWVGWLAVPESWRVVGFVLLAVADVAVPVLSERNRMTPWHPRHIAERYGLFTIIVLGESVAAAAGSVQEAMAEPAAGAGLYLIAGTGLVTVFAMWWLYFDRSAEDRLTTARVAFAWGYGHLVILASAAAVGAGVQLMVERHVGHVDIDARAAAAALAIPVAIYLAALWVLHVMPLRRADLSLPHLVAVIVVATAPLWGGETAMVVVAIGTAGLVAAVATVGHRTASRSGEV